MTTRVTANPDPRTVDPIASASEASPLRNGNETRAEGGPRLDVVELRKRYGGQAYALDGVSASFEIGLTGLLGPNGAGKTTLIRCIAGVQNWDSGSIHIRSEVPDAPRWGAVGYMPESVVFPRELRVASFLRFVCSAKGVGRTWRDEVEEKIVLTGLSDVAARVVGSLSKGYRQRLGLAQAMIGSPPVLVLDEPVSSLDPINIVEVRRAIRRYAERACVLVSTHQLAEATALCDRVVLLDRGRVAFDGPMQELGRGSHRSFDVEVLSDDATNLRRVAAEIGAGCALRTLRADEAYVLTLSVADEKDLAARVGFLSSCGFGIVGVRPTGDALEEAFAHAVANADPSGTNR